MRAVVYDAFGEPPEVREVPDPVAPDGGVVVRVVRTGLCRSDWHGWMGHDADVAAFPHVPGHELAGVVEAVGGGVARWRPGDRVTVPFVCACGACAVCRDGDHQVCPYQVQPGFGRWGSFAELVALDHADVNLVAVPATLDLGLAATLGCRVATAFRALLAVGRLTAGEEVLVAGCGGVGLAAVRIAVAAGARVVALDVDAGALERASAAGAAAVVPAGPDAAAAVREATGGGAHLSLDAIGAADVVATCLQALRPRGRHVQVGLLPAPVTVPLAPLVGRELELLGAHGMAAHAYPALLAMVADGRLDLGALVGRTIGLDEAPAALVALGDGSPDGVVLVDPTR